MTAAMRLAVLGQPDRRYPPDIDTDYWAVAERPSATGDRFVYVLFQRLWPAYRGSAWEPGYSAEYEPTGRVVVQSYTARGLLEYDMPERLARAWLTPAAVAGLEAQIDR